MAASSNSAGGAAEHTLSACITVSSIGFPISDAGERAKMHQDWFDDFCRNVLTPEQQTLSFAKRSSIFNAYLRRNMRLGRQGGVISNSPSKRCSGRLEEEKRKAEAMCTEVPAKDFTVDDA